MNSFNIFKYDLISFFIYITLVAFGLLNIFSSSYTENFTSIFDYNTLVGKQIIFFLISIIGLIFILFFKPKIFDNISFYMYILSIILLIGLFVFGVERGGARSWYSFGPISFQPSEFAKLTTSLFLAKFLSIVQTDLNKFRDILMVFTIILIPVILIIIQPDPGSAIIYTALFFPIFREGLSLDFFYYGLIVLSIFIFTLLLNWSLISIILLIIFLIYYLISRYKKLKFRFIKNLLLLTSFILISFSTNYIFENILEQRHRDRINLILGKEFDISGIGYNTNQSIIAISKGGFSGAGFLKGTQTKGNFVPRQHTDYIFSTIGEEWGFLGSLMTIILFCVFIIRLLIRAEKQAIYFRRIYIYSFSAMIFLHFFINIGMSIGIVPSIGIPLPFISYGGSSLLIFSIMFFIYLNFDSSRLKES